MTPILVQFDFFYFIEKSEERKKISLGRNGLISDTEFFSDLLFFFFIFLKECDKVS